MALSLTLRPLAGSRSGRKRSTLPRSCPAPAEVWTNLFQPRWWMQAWTFNRQDSTRSRLT